MTEDIIRDREEHSEQIRALHELKKWLLLMVSTFQNQLAMQRSNQWLYFGYLAAIKEQNGAAMSLGRVSTFLDIYIERDLQNGTLTEKKPKS